MDTSLAIIVIAIILILLYVRARTEKENAETKLNTEIENDALVLIHGDYDTIKKVVIDFCKIYNEKSLEIRPRLIEYLDYQTYIIFPYNITFEKLCFFHNYLTYPHHLKVDFELLSWVSVNAKTDWYVVKTMPEKRMLYIPKTETEYTNVYAITEDHRHFKIDFSNGLLEINIDRPYTAPRVDLEILRAMPYEDLQ